MTDQFTGGTGDRYREVEETFARLADRYEGLYYTGLYYERRAKAQLRTGQTPHAVFPLFERALHCFSEAEKLRPAGNDDSILRWNRCVRLLQTPSMVWQEQLAAYDAEDAPPR